jgi:DNA mismatch endonuclease (patch repair protein)
MSVLARSDTKPELALRRALYARGHRYRVQLPVPDLARRRIDVAFPGRKVAVFVDGCFWHRCPTHCKVPAANEEWWLWKLERNTARDADTTRHLTEQGWNVVRVWEHESVDEMVSAVESALDQELEADRPRERVTETSKATASSPFDDRDETR